MMMSFSWITIAMIITSFTTVFTSHGLLFFLITTFMQCAYAVQSNISREYMARISLTPPIEEEEIFFGEYLYNQCENYNETTDRRLCYLDKADAKLKKFSSVSKGLMGFTIVSCILYIIVALIITVTFSDFKVEPFIAFIIISIVTIILSLPIYTSTIINKKPYKQLLKENDNFFPVFLGLTFVSSILFFIIAFLVFYGECPHVLILVFSFIYICT